MQKKLRKWKITTTGKIVIITLLLMLVGDWFIYNKIMNQSVPVAAGLPSITADELSKYNGDSPDMPIYLALNGYVYDVSAGKDDFYGQGQAYHDLVGKDSSALLNIFGGEIIKRKYKIVGVYKP